VTRAPGYGPAPMRRPRPQARPLVAILFAFAALVGNHAAWAQSQATLPESLQPDVERARQAFPNLIEYSPRPGGVVISGVDPGALEALLARLTAGEFTPEIEAALRVLFQGIERQVGAVGALGRNVMQEIAGTTAVGGGKEALRGVARLLFEVMEAGNAYSILAQELLSEKLRCGAAAIGDEDLTREIATRVSPDVQFGVSHTDGTVADRYGLHDQANLYTVVADGPRVVATGGFGTIAISTDAGLSWATPATGTDEPLYAAAFGPEAEIWAVGRRGTVLHSTDNGRHFERIPTPFDRHFFGVSPLGPGEALVVGDYGLQLVRDREAGVWRCEPRDEDIILGRVVPAGGDAALVAEFGTLERLPGGRVPGERGRLSGVPEDVYLFDLWFDAAGEVGIAVGLAGTVLRSEDGGAHWAAVATGLDADLYGVGGADDRVVVVGERGVVAISDDRGRSFSRADRLALRLPFYDVALSDPDTGFMVGPRGLIVALRDGGERAEVVRGPGVEAPTAHDEDTEARRD